MTTGMIHDQSLEKNFEKQMGCFTGFRQIFDRHQLLTGKRLYTTKRLPPPPPTSDGISPETEKPEKSLKETEKPSPRTMTSPSPDRYKSPELRSPAPVQTPPRSSLPHPIFELNEATKYSWKFAKETPRLSLDSRATFDSTKGSLRTNTNKSTEDNSRRSTSVIARLMGLESTPPEAATKPAELTRSASESRVSRELNSNFQPNHVIRSNVIREKVPDPIRKPQHTRTESRAFKSPQQRRSFFDSADIFPEPKQTTVSIYGEIERRMKLKGLDEQSQDLETLKQILEAMQLKGLLHSKKAQTPVKNKNVVYERTHSFPCDDNEHQSFSSVMSVNRRGGSNSPISTHRSKSEYRRSDSIPAVSPRRERVSVDRSIKSPTRGRNASSPTRSELSARNSNVRRNQLISERRAIESPEHRRISPINSPRITPRRNAPDVANRSPRSRKSTPQICAKEKISTTFVLEDESSYSSTISETDTERCKSEDYKEGKSLLERCDKLLHSIAEMNSTESQPSPISVLDSSFYKDESLSPSPVMKRTISFTDSSVELTDEELGSPGISSVNSKFEDEIDDNDYIYISRILRASSYLTEDDDIFLFVEKQHYFKGKDYSKEARLHRKLIFDIAKEIIDQNKQLPPWKTFSPKNSNISKPLARQIWSELQRIQEPTDQSPDLFGIVCGVLKKDLAADGWGDLSVKMSDAVLDIERMIFKDLIGESIRDLAEFAGNSRFLAPRRKLVF
ncbi:hypothetical protein ACET3Z_012749 [Daucus carota]